MIYYVTYMRCDITVHARVIIDLPFCRILSIKTSVIPGEYNSPAETVLQKGELT